MGQQQPQLRCPTGRDVAVLFWQETANLYGFSQNGAACVVTGLDVNTGQGVPLIQCGSPAVADALVSLLNDAVGVHDDGEAKVRLQRYVDSRKGLNN